MPVHILAVDDDEIFLFQLEQVLKGSQYEVTRAKDAFEALNLLGTRDFDITLTDIKLPRMSGLDLLKAIKEKNDPRLVVVMSAYGTIDLAVEAMKQGASDFLIKPFSNDYLLMVIERTLNQKTLLEENATLREQLGERYSFHNIIGKNFKMQKLYNLISAVSRSEATILITGETGTGKDMVAQAIHYHSLRKEKRFVNVDCSVLSDTLLESELFGHERGAFTHAVKQRIGRFEYADGGTIFLNEIGELSPALQAKLLRVLQEKKFERVGSNKTIEVNVRIIAATNKDLRQEITCGRFREDLYYRLNVIELTLPPLRERRDDIPLLAKLFLKKYSKEAGKSIKGFSQEALAKMMKHEWPGNVRELEHVIEREAILDERGVISEVGLQSNGASRERMSWQGDHLDTSIPFQKLKKALIEGFEQGYLKKILTECRGNVTRACQCSLLDYKTFYEKMKKYGLRRSDFTGRA